MLIAIEKTIFVGLLLGLLALTLAACAAPNIDTNGYYSGVSGRPVKCEQVDQYRKVCRSI